MLKFPSICRFIVKNKVFFRSAGYSASVEYTKTIIHLSVSDSEIKVMDIYQAAKQLGKYPLLFTSTSVNNCQIFSACVLFGSKH